MRHLLSICCNHVNCPRMKVPSIATLACRMKRTSYWRRRSIFPWSKSSGGLGSRAAGPGDPLGVPGREITLCPNLWLA